jgi:type I restriction enzyme, S subunit
MPPAESVRFHNLFADPLRNGLTRPKAVRGQGTKMVNMGEIFAHERIGEVSMERVPLSDRERESYLLKPGDLLFARQSLVLSGAGKCSIFLGASEPTTFESHIIRARLDRSAADPLFYFYFFRSEAGRNAIESIVEQVAAAGIRGSDPANLEVPMPPLLEKRAIAHILGTLDDKIELNRQMNETLEAMARALFKSWFVDFDPVRAKAEGRNPGLPPDIATLFPDRFDDSELAEIPVGWWVRLFSTMVEINGGGTPKTSVSKYWGGDIPWFSVVDAPSESDVFVVSTEKYITQDGLKNSAARLLPEGTTIISARGTVGKLAVVGVPMTMNQSCYALRGLEAGSYFTYYATRNLVSILKQRSHGSVFDTITRDTLAGVNFIAPPKAVLEAFERVTEPLMQGIKSNLSESRTLAALHDRLLPKLISGELRIQNVDCSDLRGV